MDNTNVLSNTNPRSITVELYEVIHKIEKLEHEVKIKDFTIKQLRHEVEILKNKLNQ